MTSEVAIMNKSAVALAADSATTITYWRDGEQKRRYFKGANKIFHLSRRCPVGLMIYGSGSLQGVPWEIIGKAFRDHLGTASYSSLDDYADQLFWFLGQNAQLFSDERQNEQTVQGFVDSAINVGLRILSSDAVRKADANTKAGVVAERLKAVTEQINKAPLICDDCREVVEGAKAKFRDIAEKRLRGHEFAKVLADSLDLKGLTTLGADAFFKRNWTPLQTTGLVLAGFGDDEYFPVLLHYECFGVLMGELVFRKVEDDCKRITFDNVSEILPVAQDEMVNTFIYGASINALATMDWNCKEALREFAETLQKDGHLKGGPDVDALRAKLHTEFTDKTRVHMWDEHSIPLKRAIGMLPVGELADLAETLVSIESLKERVTRESESVSGPIDVAVITKGDGFIWIKRKHYFKPELNVRYMARRQNEQAGD